MDPEFKGDALCVIGIPAVADNEAKNKLQEAARAVFDGVLLIPEPFLAALGMRDEERLQNLITKTQSVIRYLLILVREPPTSVSFRAISPSRKIYSVFHLVVMKWMLFWTS